MNRFEFRGLFIFDLANNHQGDVQHGLRIIREIGRVVQDHGVRAALKFQFRDLDSFIHPGARREAKNKHVSRFLSTRLSREDVEILLEEVRKQSLVTMSTPFDEPSVDMLVDLDIEVIKIGSPSATDWPLLEKVAEAGKPVVFSTGGLSLKQIDALVSFFDHRRTHYAMMHCVSIYPTPDERLELGQIEMLRHRYPGRPVGFSTHEDPSDTVPVQIAVAKGAELFERHVGLETESIRLNAYSSTPEQIDRWLGAYRKARVLCGSGGERAIPKEESESLDSLKRGVYARRPLKEGVPLGQADVYFAMPCAVGQLSAGEWKDTTVTLRSFDRDDPLPATSVTVPRDLAHQEVYDALHEIKAMLNEARIALPSDFKLEISHHYGLVNFRQFGAVLIGCVNRTYCKKLIVQLPRQEHPCHYHKRKEETFQVLHGVLDVELDDRRKTLRPGDTLLIQPGVWHRFWTDTGVIVEEISTTHFDDDSFYEDKAINRVDRAARKTVVEHWGRHQI